METTIEKTLVPNSSGEFKTCPGYFTIGQCEHGHRFVKTIYCGREWCPVCGQNGSVSHMRKVSRWLPKAFQIYSMGYFVFTIPIEARWRFRDKQSLSYLMKYATIGDNKKKSGQPGILKSFHFDRGLSRWHLFGDLSNEYNPHLNVIVEGGRLTHSTLRSIKRLWAELLQVKQAVVHYEYSSEPGKKFHSVKYITRPTFTDYDNDPDLAVILYNFRNTRYWGKWNSPRQWSLHDGEVDYETMIKFEKGICPFCGSKLTWSNAININTLEAIHGELLPITTGYYLLM